MASIISIYSYINISDGDLFCLWIIALRFCQICNDLNLTKKLSPTTLLQCLFVKQIRQFGHKITHNNCFTAAWAPRDCSSKNDNFAAAKSWSIRAASCSARLLSEEDYDYIKRLRKFKKSKYAVFMVVQNTQVSRDYDPKTFLILFMNLYLMIK